MSAPLFELRKSLDREKKDLGELTDKELEVVTVVFHQFETGLREGTIYSKVSVKHSLKVNFSLGGWEFPSSWVACVISSSQWLKQAQSLRGLFVQFLFIHTTGRAGHLGFAVFWKPKSLKKTCIQDRLIEIGTSHQKHLIENDKNTLVNKQN